MEAIIGSIVGALVGGFFTWFLSRRKPQLIICNEEYSGRFYLDVPDAVIMFRDIAVKNLGIVRLSFRNTGTQCIEKPNLTVRLDEAVEILGVSEKITPERSESNYAITNNESIHNTQKAITTSIKQNSVNMNIDRLLPYSINEETMTLDIFTNGRTEDLEVLGSGILKDGTGWAVTLKSWSKTQEKTSKILGWLSFSSLTILFMLILTYFYTRLFTPIKQFVSSEAFNKWIYDPFLWLVIIASLLTLVGHLYGGLRGFGMRIPLPFSLRSIEIWITKRRTRTK